MSESHVDLYWLPVGAGTHFQRATLLAYDWCASLITRKPRAAFVHAALKVSLNNRGFTLELMPVPKRQQVQPLLTGAVGIQAAGRVRLFRYQLLCLETDRLPDERWAIRSPVTLSTESEVADRLLVLARQVPAHVWGRRVPGTAEMWTSDSAISWLLCRTGIDARAVQLPAGTQAPGWTAGIQVAMDRRL